MDGRERIALFESQFPIAHKYALVNGFHLIRKSKSHFRLVSHVKLWVLNIYPGNHKLKWNYQPRGPFLELPDDWTLIDIVASAIMAEYPVKEEEHAGYA